MSLLIIVITMNTGKTVPIIHLFVLFKAKQVFKEIHNFINKFIFYDILSLKVYIGD